MTDNAGTAAISCLQINLNHSKLAQDCVANKIQALNNRHNEFIICVQEPYVYGSKHARKPKSCNTFFSGVPQRLDAGDLGRPTRYCYLESIYHTWDGGTDHRASLVSHPTQCVAVLGGLH